MSRQQLRSSILMFVVTFVIVLLVLGITVQKPAPYSGPLLRPAVSGTPLPQPIVASQGVAPIAVLGNGTPLPSQDTMGVRDDQDVARYPGAVLLRRNNTDMVHELHYLTTDNPAAVSAFYTNYASKKLGMRLRYNYQFNSDVHGYYLAYDDARNAGSIILFAISQSFDLPVGGRGNPTNITLDVVGQIAIPGQPTPTSLPLFINSQFRPSRLDRSDADVPAHQE